MRDLDPAIQLPAAHKLSQEPTIILGLAYSEMIYILCIAGFFGFVTSILFGMLVGNMMYMLPAFLISASAIFWGAGSFLAAYKHNKPHGYYQMKLRMTYQKLGFLNFYTTNSGFRDPRKRKN